MNRAFLLAGAMVFFPGSLSAQTSSQMGPYDTFVQRAEKSGKAFKVTMDQVIKMALENNLEIRIEDYNEELFQHRVRGSYGFYDPVVGGGLGYNRNNIPSGNILNAGAGLNLFFREGYSWDWFFRQNLPQGGDVNTALTTTRDATNSLFASVNPSYNANLLMTVTQPLLRDFGMNAVKRQIRIVQKDREISDAQFAQRVSDIIAQVQRLYWDLTLAIRDQEIRKQSMELARIQLENNKKRVEIGTLAPLDITKARAEVARREEEVIAAEARIQTAENLLKGMLSEDPQSPLWGLFLIPIEDPKFRDLPLELNKAISTAFENRPELEQLRLEMEKNGIQTQYQQNQGRWRLDLSGQFGTRGLAGFSHSRVFVDPTGNRVVVPELSRGAGDAYSQVFTGDFRNYQAGVRLEIPLRNRSHDAELGQLKVTERRLLAQRKNLEQQIMVEVRNAIQNIEIAKKRLDSARLARELSQEQLDGETKRFHAGLSTNFEVLQYQRDLSLAQLSETQTLIDYQKAISDLQKAMFTIVDENAIHIARE
ncbi:MAG: TolC family protein [Acidobacteria bacterium]|nr:TolC family protein [Acidobacteriota bacterium]